MHVSFKVMTNKRSDDSRKVHGTPLAKLRNQQMEHFGVRNIRSSRQNKAVVLGRMNDTGMISYDFGEGTYINFIMLPSEIPDRSK